jgi:hypothetical protein
MKQVYKKKGETAENEVAPKGDDQDRPQSGRGGRGGRGRGGADRGGDRGGRGARGGRGGARGGRPETEGGEERKGPRRERNENFKETYYYKFHYERPPAWEKFEIDLNTELPPIPKKEDRLKDPDQKKFEDQMAQLDR